MQKLKKQKVNGFLIPKLVNAVVCLVLFIGCADETPGPGKVKHVFVVVFDTLRADHLSSYGYPRKNAPCIEALAKDGLLFESAVSLSSWTKPSVITLLTSQWPSNHNRGYHHSKMPDTGETLATAVKKAGFETIGITANHVISKKAGFDRGFDYFKTVGSFFNTTSQSPVLYSKALQKLDTAQNQFFYLHALGPHGPYCPNVAARKAMGVIKNKTVDRRVCENRNPRGWYKVDNPAELQYLKALYDAEIYEEDQYLCKFIGDLKQKGVWDNSLVIFTSDHGEAFNEHGSMEHGDTLFNEEIRIPLIIKGPGVRDEREKGVVGLHDVAPTILSYLGIEIPKSFKGINLLKDIPSRRPIFLREFKDTAEKTDKEIFGVIVDSQKALWTDVNQGRHLFVNWNLPSGEMNTLGERPRLFKKLKQLHNKTIGKAITPKKSKLTWEEKKALKALGYID